MQLKDVDQTAESPLMLIPEVARVLLCSDATAYAAAQRGEFPTIRIGKLVRVPRREFFEWLSGQIRSGVGPT